MGEESEGFDYLRQTFPKVSEAKTKNGIFVGPQITQLCTDKEFNTKLNSTEQTEEAERHLKKSAATFYALKSGNL